MRKSRFLIGLIAATAIGLAGVGCGESSSSGAVRDTSDIARPDSSPDERRLMREYLLVGQRGLTVPPEDFGEAPDVSLPSVTGRDSGVTPSDEPGVAGGLLYELFGVNQVPSPNLAFVKPGVVEDRTPSDTSEVQEDQFAGFHQVYTSPSGRYVVAVSRAKDTLNRVDEGAPGSGFQVFQIDTPSVEETYPPQPDFGPTPELVSIRFFAGGQGEFTSGAWSRDGRFFFLSMNNRIYSIPFTESNGSLDFDVAREMLFSAGPTLNNAVQMILSPAGDVLLALDNASGAIVSYSVNPENGELTLSGSLPTVSDPRGFTLDRSGNFLYVAGRRSKQLAGYRLGDDGGLTPIELFPAEGLGAVPATMPLHLGDVTASARRDQLFLGAYNGVVSGYTVDVTTGALTAGSRLGTPLGGARNLANLEVDPTGEFVLAAYEHDFDTFQDFVTFANGFGTDESSVFANTDSTTNELVPLNATPNFDLNGRIAYLFPSTLDRAFAGSVQAFRVLDEAGNLTVRDATDVTNPYGLGFFQLVLPIPAEEGPVVP